MSRIKICRWIAPVLSLTMALGLCSGCGEASLEKGASSASGGVAEVATGEAASPAATKAAFHGINAPGFERTMEQAEREASGERYVHGEDGYFLLAEHGADTELKIQKELRSSWVYAASTSMESSSLVTRGERIHVDPYEILDAVYASDKKEGILPDAVGNKEVGGHGRYIVDTLTNGFGKHVLASVRDCEGLSIAQIQEAIRTYGAMTTGMTEAHNGRGFYDGYFTQLDTENKNDHAVTIVGWDDHFPREIFTKTSFVDMPSQDGAWIAQDSLMNTDYIYISYDTQIIDAYIYELSDDYGEVVSYDAGCEGTVKTGAETTLANVFHKKGTLAAVGTYIPEDGETAQVRVYEEKSGKLLGEASETFPIKGYYTLPLAEPVSVSDYRIEVSYDGAAPVEGDAWDDEYVTFRAQSKRGESYVKRDGKWVDLANYNYNNKSKKKAETRKAKRELGAGSVPHNACIKALYQ